MYNHNSQLDWMIDLIITRFLPAKQDSLPPYSLLLVRIKLRILLKTQLRNIFQNHGLRAV